MAWWSAEKQSRDVGGDLEAAEMPLKAGMWRRGTAAGDAPVVGCGGGGLGFGVEGNARLSQRNERRPGLFSSVCEITDMPPELCVNFEELWVLMSIRCGRRFRMPPTVRISHAATTTRFCIKINAEKVLQ
jgi:hypothetical protein